MKKILLCSITLLFAVSIWAAGASEADIGKGAFNKWGESIYGKNVDHTTYGWLVEDGVINADGTVTATIMEVPEFKTKTYTTAWPMNDAAHTNSITGVSRAEAMSGEGDMFGGGWLVQGSFIEIQKDAEDRCMDFELIQWNEVLMFDSASYGPELTAKGGAAGNMVALGWVLGKSPAANTITIGDGNHVTNVFEETYTLADDCRIYCIDNDHSDGFTYLSRGTYSIKGSWDLVKEGSFDDINVTKTINGEIYKNPERWTALCVFDSSYKSSWEDGTAKVKELYLYNNPILLGTRNLVIPDGMQYAGTSWYATMSKLENSHNYSYDGSCEPFALMEDRCYSIGDSYTNMFMFVGDDGTISTLDMGNRAASYQYWLNIAKLGYDPRQIDNLILTHGHGDHYQALYEGWLMIERGGNAVNVVVNKYAQGTTVSSSDGSTVYELNATLKDPPVLSIVDVQPEWDEWLDFMGPGADTYIWRAIGHSSDTASFVFKLTATDTDEYFNAGDKVSLVYFGGYGSVNNTSRGVNRNQIAYSMQYEGAVIAPWAECQSDYVYPIPQHSNQYPMYEIWKATQVAKIPFMEGFVGGAEQCTNMMEKRVALMTYERFNTDYWNKEDAFGDALEAKTGFRASSSGKGFLDTLEDNGPYKREAGEYIVDVKGVQVIHGFQPWLNKTDLFAGQTNVYGYDLSEGILIDKDSYVADPDGWYIQLICNVQDDYDGGLLYEENFFKGQYATGTKGLEEETLTSPWLSGPIEFGNNPDGWVEILRLERFDSKAEALAYAKKLTNGSYSTPYEVQSVNGGNLYDYPDTANYTVSDYGAGAGLETFDSYKVSMKQTCEIIVGETFEDTFRKVK